MIDSKPASSKKWIECGRVGRPWGVKGQVSVFWTSGMCPVEVGRGKVYTRQPDGGYIPHVILSARQKGERWIVALEDITSPEEAAGLRHKKLFVSKEELSALPQGEFYCYQIVGLNVETESGEVLGEVINVYSTGSNDVYEVKPKSGKGETVLIPAIDSVIIKIDLEKKTMIIRPMEGMLD